VTSRGITFVVSQLERQGLLTRRPHPNDGRSVLVRLTSRGRRLADQLIAAVVTADAEVFAHFGDADRRTTERLLRRVQAGVESAMVSERGATSDTSD